MVLIGPNGQEWRCAGQVLRTDDLTDSGKDGRREGRALQSGPSAPLIGSEHLPVVTPSRHHKYNSWRV